MVQKEGPEHYFQPSWLKFGMQVAKIIIQPSCYLQKGQILAVNGRKLTKIAT